MGVKTIGCPEGYQAVITRQPGAMTGLGQFPQALGSLTDILSLTWNRIRSAPGRATITVAGCGQNNDVLVNNQTFVDPWAFELILYRDSEIAFMGPILDVIWHADTSTWEIDAGDIMTWPQVREIQPAYTSPLTDAATILVDLLNDYFFANGDDPDLFRHVIQVDVASVPVSVVYKTATFTVQDKIRDLVNMGANYAVVGRTILVFGEDPPNIVKPMMLSANDISGTIRMFKSGRAPFGVHIVGRGQGVEFGTGPTAPDEAYFGKVSRITQFEEITSGPQLISLTNSWYDTVRVMRHDIDISAGALLGPEATFFGSTEIMSQMYALDFLVPGYRYDISVTTPEFPIKGSFPMRLDELNVNWTPEEGEKVGVSFITLGLEHV